MKKTELQSQSWNYNHENQELRSWSHVHEKKSSVTGAVSLLQRLRSPVFKYAQVIEWHISKTTAFLQNLKFTVQRTVIIVRRDAMRRTTTPVGNLIKKFKQLFGNRTHSELFVKFQTSLGEQWQLILVAFHLYNCS